MDAGIRKLRDLSADYPLPRLLSDQLVLAGREGQPADLFAIEPLDETSVHPLAGEAFRNRGPGVSPDRKSLVVRLQDVPFEGATPAFTGLEVFSLDGEVS